MKTLLSIFFFTVIMHAQDINTIITDPRSEKPMLIGYCTREAFSDTSFSWWFDSEYENYEVDTEVLESIGEIDENTSVTIVLGTWCGDSRREVPRFLKILDHLNFPADAVNMIAVDRSKVGMEGEVNDLSIEKVPTFIFYLGDEEAGRIIESPEESLEADMAAILAE